jgi:D-sedoheptulose 7-phosphate isomerase
MELGTNVGSLTAWVNDEGWDDVYVRLLAPWISRNDVIVAFSVNGGSGYSPNLVRALELAEETGAWSIGIAGNGGGEFVRLCRTMILIPTPADSEWITPHTESAHVIVHHLICSRLRERITRHA